MVKPRIAEMEDFKLDDQNSVDIIKSVCPINMSIIIPKSKDEDNESYSFIGRVTWLCKTVFDNLLCLTSNYVAEDEYDEESLVNIPLLEDKNYVNFKIESDMLMGTLPHYLTDLEFSFDSNSDSIHHTSDTEIYCVGIEYKDEQTIFHKITVSPEVFGVLKFMDEYILEGVPNYGNLHRSILTGPIEDNNTSIFVVDKINILDIARIGGRRSTSVAIKMEVSHVQKTEEKYNLLVPFDLGKKFPKKKFGKKKAEELSNGYFKDPNNYIDDFTFNCELKDVDYLFLRCRNANDDSILFAIPNDIKSVLIDTIEEYDANKK